jgi:hypothetical protein
MNNIYIASKTRHASMWQHLRRALEETDSTMCISSTWIDEAEVGATVSFSALWARITKEVKNCTCLIAWVEYDDVDRMHGMLVEIGMALATDKPVYLCCDNSIRAREFLGSWFMHPSVMHCLSVGAAVRHAERWFNREPEQVGEDIVRKIRVNIHLANEEPLHLDLSASEMYLLQEGLASASPVTIQGHSFKTLDLQFNDNGAMKYHRVIGVRT